MIRLQSDARGVGNSMLSFRLNIIQCLVVCGTALCYLSTSAPVLCKNPPAKDGEVRTFLVVLIYDKDCKVACTKVRPILQELAQKYENRLEYLELNASADVFAESIKTAATWGIKTFLSDSTDIVPIVGIFNTKRKRIKELQGYKTKEVYESAIEKALTQQN